MYDKMEIRNEYHAVTERRITRRGRLTQVGNSQANKVRPTFEERAALSGMSFGDYFRQSFDVIDGMELKS